MFGVAHELCGVHGRLVITFSIWNETCTAVNDYLYRYIFTTVQNTSTLPQNGQMRKESS